jgi:hypothetical protein
MNYDCDYLGAIEKLETWAHMSTGGYSPASLRGAIEKSPIRVSDFERDLTGIKADADAISVVALADAPADQEIDGNGRVLLSDPDERARMLTDPLEFERAYQRRLDGAGGSDEGREAYRQEFRQLLDAGVDPIATLERSMRVQRTERVRLDAEQTSLQRQSSERERRAQERELNDRITDARSELDRL